jgi:hypothetical protein
MHTVILVAGGFAMLALFAFAGRAFGGAHGFAIAAILFLPVWLIGAAINLYVGVATAGYSVKEESPIFLLIFSVPAARSGVTVFCKTGAEDGEMA